MKAKKIILYISCVPYIYMLINLFYVAIFGHVCYSGEKTYFIMAMGSWISCNFFTIFFIMPNPYNLVLFLCLTYQLFYLITSLSDNKKDRITYKKNRDVPRILFVITLIFWFLLIMYILYKMIFGIRTPCFWMCDGETLYGLDALPKILFSLLVLVVIPVIPALIAYDFLYIVIRKKKGLNLIKKRNFEKDK